MAWVERWARVLECFAVRYGAKVKGWWIDGCYVKNGGMAAALAVNVLHSSVAALPANAAAIWMNLSGSTLASYWSKRPPPTGKAASPRQP